MINVCGKFKGVTIGLSERVIGIADSALVGEADRRITAFEEGLKSATGKKWKHKSPHCICFLLARRVAHTCSKECRPEFFDHGDGFWSASGQRVLVLHPYCETSYRNNLEDDVRAFATKHKLSWRLSGGLSWHFPGSTMAVILWNESDDAAILPAIEHF